MEKYSTSLYFQWAGGLQAMKYWVLQGTDGHASLPSIFESGLPVADQELAGLRQKAYFVNAKR